MNSTEGIIYINQIYIVKKYLDELKGMGLLSFEEISGYSKGVKVKDTGERKIFRIYSADGRVRFYLKKHSSRSWLFLIFKRNEGDGGWKEWKNILMMKEKGIPVVDPVACGIRRKNGCVESFTLTENLDGYKRLEIYMAENFTGRKSAENVKEKREIIKAVALLTKKMHEEGLCHGDYYLTHLMIRRDNHIGHDIKLIDLQRVRRRTGRRVIKDLASINFASKSTYLTSSDRMRFIKYYLGKQKLDLKDKHFIKRIIKKTEKIARHDVSVSIRKAREHGKISIPQANVSKILFIENVNIGDLINATPAIKAVRERFPYARVDVLISDNLSEIVRCIPLFDRIYSYSKYSSGKHRNKFEHMIKLWRLFFNYIRKEKYDIAIATRTGSSPSTAFKALLTGAKYRIGSATGNWRWKRCWMDWVWTIGVKPSKTIKHEIERCFDIVEVIGVDREKADKSLILVIDEEYIKRAREFLRFCGIYERDFVLIHITSRHPRNRWSVEKFVKLSREMMIRYDKKIVVTFGPQDIKKAECIANECGGNCFIFRTDSILQLCGIIKESPLFITTEGGPMHIAAALGTPTVAIFGKSPVELWRPWGEGHVVIKRGDNAETVSVYDVLEGIEKMRESANRRLSEAK